MGRNSSVNVSMMIDVGANIGKAKSAVGELQKLLNGLTLDKGITGNFNKTFNKLEQEFINFQALAKKDLTSTKDLTSVEKSYNNILNLLNSLSVQAANIKGLDANKLIPNDFSNKLKEISNEYENLANKQKKFESEAVQKKTDYDSDIKKFQEILEARKQAAEELQNANQRFLEAQKEFDNLLAGKKNVSAAKASNTETINKLEEQIKLLEQEKALREEANRIAKSGDNNAKAKFNKNMEKEGFGNIQAKIGFIQANEEEIKKIDQQIAEKKRQAEELQEVNGKLEQAKINYDAAKKTATGAATKDARIKIGSSLTDQEINEEIRRLQALRDAVEVPTVNLDQIRQKFSELANVPLDQVPKNLEDLQKALVQLPQDKANAIVQELNKIASTGSSLPGTVSKLGNAFSGLRNELTQMEMVSRDFDRMKWSVANFFSVFTGARMLRRTLNQASQAIKELDAAMTETAVVTNFSVSDMWDQLDLYTETANKLGATTLGAYETMTLFYQQGLNTEQAFAVGTETMKMARIAGMEYSEATQKMTAALRGFNMEINETSAQRVNDVYSELAKITAADTDQIATAMTKTASIAESANMSFENTAAFLTQIIETTQEAPETAGTALKTIIARFSEVKELYSKGQLTGTDEEGEVININKIDKALKSVGMSLNKFILGEQGLDEVFMELASKWDTLDLATQRYIATQAAGSRQQSRFIAMMNDYERTVELATAARDSEGSSEEQFGKTLDSMEAKINEMKNAWQAFTLSIMDSDTLKTGIDALTTILQLINNITDALGGKSSGALKIGAALGLGVLGKKTLGGLMQLGHAQSLVTTKLLDPTKESVANKTMSELMANRKSAFKQGFLGSRGINRRQAITADALYNSMSSNYEKEQAIYQARLAEQYKIIDDDKFYNKYAEAEQKQGRIPKTKEELKERARVNLRETTKDPELEKLAQKQEKLIKGATGWGIVLAAAGTGAQAIASSMEKSGKYSEKLTDSISGVATAAQLAGTSFMLIGQVLPLLGKASLVGPFMQVAVVVAGIVATVKILDAIIETSAEKSERLAEEAANAQAAAEAASKAYDELLSGEENYNDRLNNLEKLVKGTSEYTKALQEANEATLELAQSKGLKTKYEKGIIKIIDFQEVKDEFSNNKKITEDISKISNYQTEKDSLQKKNEEKLKDRAEELIQTVYDETGLFGDVESLLYNTLVKGEIKFQDLFLNTLQGDQSEKENKVSTEIANFNNSLLIDKDKEQLLENNTIKSLIDTSILETTGSNVIDDYITNLVADKISGEKTLLDRINQAEENIDIKRDKSILGDYANSDEFKNLTNQEKKDKIAYTKVANEIQGSFQSQYDSQFEKFDSFNKEQLERIDNFSDITTSEAEAFINSMGESTQKIAQEIYDSLKDSALSNFKYSTNDISKYLEDTEPTNLSADELIFSQKFENFNQNFLEENGLASILTPTQIAKTGQQINNIFTNFGASSASSFINSLNDAFSQEDSSDFFEALSKINTSSVFSTFNDIDRQIQNGSQIVTSSFIKLRNDLTKNLGVEGIFKAFLSDQGYQEIENKVTELLDEFGNVTASNVLDLADDLDLVNDMLETGITNAATLAEILQMLAVGDIGLDEVNEQLAWALGLITQFENSLATAFKFIDDYNPTRSVKEIGEHYSEVSSNIVESLEAGRYGDPLLFQNVERLFGRDGLVSLVKGIENLDSSLTSTDDILSSLDDSTNGMITALQGAINNGNLSSMWGYYINKNGGVSLPGKNKGTGYNLGYNEETGEVTIPEEYYADLTARQNMGEGLAMDLFAQDLSKAFNISPEQASTFISEFGGYSIDSQGFRAMKESSLTQGIGNLIGEEQLTSGQWENYLSEMASLGFNEEEAKQKVFGNQYTSGGGDSQPSPSGGNASWPKKDVVFSDTGLTIEQQEILKNGNYSDEAYKSAGLSNNFVGQQWAWTPVKNESGIDYELSSKPSFDATKGVETMRQQGASDEQINKTLAEQNALYGEGTKAIATYQDAKGNLVEITQEEGESYTELADRAKSLGVQQEEIKSISEGVALGIQKAFEGLDLANLGEKLGPAGEALSEFASSASQVVSAASEIQNAIDSIEPPEIDPIKLTLDKSEIDSFSVNVPIAKTYVYVGLKGPGISRMRHGKTGPTTSSLPGFATGKSGSNPHKNSAQRYYEGMAQVGEEGTELIMTEDGDAYLAGIHGPTFTYINKNDTVYTAQETKKILGRVDSKAIPGFDIGYNNQNKPSGGGGDGGSKKANEENTWDPDYDRFYNLLDDIEKQLREQTKLERNLEIIKRNQEKSSNLNEARQIFQDQRTNYEDQADAQRRSYELNYQLLKGKQWEIQNYMAENPSFQKFARYNEETDTIDISWDMIMSRAGWDSDYGQDVDEYISKVEDLRDQLWEAEDAMMDAEDALRDLQDEFEEYLNELKQNYLDTEQALYDALVSIKQQEITDLQEITDIQFNSNAQILTSIQEVIAEQRKLRDIAEAREDLEEKQRRLALLRRDGSGANALEIKKLEEELEDQQENFVDSLVDKSLEDLSMQNDKAQQQRQEQITLLQNLLDFNTEYGVFWPQISEMLESAFSEDGYLDQASALVEVMKKADNFKGMSELGQDKWWDDLQKTVVNAILGLDEAKREEAGQASNEELNQSLALLAQYGIDAYDVLEFGALQANDFDREYADDSERRMALQSQRKKADNKLNDYNKEKQTLVQDLTNVEKEYYSAKEKYDKNPTDENAVEATNLWEQVQHKQQKVDAINSVIRKMEEYRAIIDEKLASFKTGGIANFTGPAWLDGTKSKPEIVLNAQDTKNFLQLKDILREMDLDNLNSKAATYFDIHIDVDEISSDYDVDKLANRVKELVVSSAQYRNNVVINRKR